MEQPLPRCGRTVGSGHLMTASPDSETVAGSSRPAFPSYAEIIANDVNPAPDWLLDHQPAHVTAYELDTERYWSPEFLQREAKDLWSKVWQVACRENDIPNVGDYIEYQIMNKSVLIVRTAASTIQAFHNACRHRGTALATGTGSTECFTCPFHGWTYDLDGALTKISFEWDFEHVDKKDLGLRPVQADTFDGWVYINLDTQAPPLSDHLGDTIMRQLEANPDAPMHKVWHFERVMPCNWKILQEAFMEAYHVAVTHPHLSAYVGDAQCQYDSYGVHARMLNPMMVPSASLGGEYTEQEIVDEALALIMDLRATGGSGIQVPEGVTARHMMSEMTRQQWQAAGVDLSKFSDAELIDTPLYSIFPNFMPFRGPAGHVCYRFRPNGDDPNTSLFEVMHFLPVPNGQAMPRDAQCQTVPPGKRFSDHEASAETMGAAGRVLDQDLANLERVQRGIRGLDSVVFGRRQEANIINFERSLDNWLGA